MTRLLGLVIVSVHLLICAAQAQTANCATIADAIERLACYDKGGPPPRDEDTLIIEKAKHALLKILKDPTSARFEGLKILTTGKERAVCGWVNAKNSMGGYTGRQPLVYVIANDRGYVLSTGGDYRAFKEGMAASKRLCSKYDSQ